MSEVTESPIVMYTPATTDSQLGGHLYDRITVGLSTSKYIPARIVEVLLLLSEVFTLNIPEWIMGERLGDAPPVSQRIASSVAGSRLKIDIAVNQGGRRKVAVLTGGANGLGLQAAFAIAEAGYHLIIGDRATELAIRAVEAIKAKTNNPHVEFVYVNLGSFNDIRNFAQEIERRTPIVDLLVNNAGVMDLPSFRPTVEGFDSQFAINYLSYYYLTHLLLPLIKKASPNQARIVNTASSAHYGASKINYEGITSAKYYDRLHNYCGSKLACVMFTRMLAKRLASSYPNITVNCLHPGSCHTALFKNSFILNLLTTIGFQIFLRSAERGSRTIKYLCLSEEVENISGEYWFDERIRPRNPAANDVKMQEELEKYTRRVLGLPERFAHL